MKMDCKSQIIPNTCGHNAPWNTCLERYICNPHWSHIVELPMIPKCKITTIYKYLISYYKPDNFTLQQTTY